MPYRPQQPKPANHDRWLVSYADFITLLFAFFTTLYAISNVDLQKAHRLVTALQVAFDTKDVQGATGALGSSPASRRADSLRDGATTPTVTLGVADLPKLPPKALAAIGRGYLEATLSGVRSRLGTSLAPAIGDGRVSLEMDRRGLLVSIRESGTFKTGSADLSEGMRALLGEVGSALREVDNLVRVEGHTDDVPIHTPKFGSNWDLSTARATVVVSYFVQESRLSPDRLSAAGYAEYHPRVANSDTANRARNRRVDIVILNQTTSEAEEPVAGGR